ncbi:MAG TPA: ABC transporter ATP-binding protein, partial [Sphaerochaetaceae bacterium]|nr:ABC transporter ATP-binding protein [Sphaerochaetaceae bacterium]
SRLEYDFTVYECVAMGRYAHGDRLSVLQETDHRIIKEALSSMALSHLSNRISTELSGGEYQRMLIARALAQQSKVILLDEPVSHLDIHNQREILRLLRSLVDRNVATVICVLHDLNAVGAFSDLVVMMRSGVIVAEGTAHEVLTKERIESVYRIEADLEMDKATGRPIILPRWRG